MQYSYNVSHWFRVTEIHLVYGGSVTIVTDTRTHHKTPATAFSVKRINSLLDYLDTHRYVDAHLEWFERFGHLD